MENNFKFDDIRKLIKNHKLAIEINSEGEDLNCIICKGLLIDACKSNCGCQYCYTCINNYLEEIEKYCPGNKWICKKRTLVMETDIIRMTRINKKVFNTRALCPNVWCHSKIELRLMDSHLRICEREILTPSIRSNVTPSKKIKINVNVWKESELKLERRMKTLEEKLFKLKRTTLQSNIEEGEDEGEAYGKRRKENTDSHVLQIREFQESVPNINQGKFSSNNDFIKVPVDYCWTIDDWKIKIKMWKYNFSKPFYSNDYKFCLRLWIDKSCIGLSCVIMTGGSDDKVEWPMRKAITLSIINKDTKKAYKSKMFHYDTYPNKNVFDRPTMDQYNIIGECPFLCYDNLKVKHWIFNRKSLVLTCAITNV